jgi:hypothetical protein
MKNKLSSMHGRFIGGIRSDVPPPKVLSEENLAKVKEVMAEDAAKKFKFRDANLSADQLADLVRLNIEMGRLRTRVSVYEKRDAQARRMFTKMLKLIEGEPGWSRTLDEVRMWLAVEIPKEADRGGKTHASGEVCEGRR